MTRPATLARLRDVQRRLCALVEDLDDEAYRAQFHPDLSPLGWHLGHCAFIENYWLREVVLGDDRLTRPWTHHYIPANSAKPERGPALPPMREMLDAVRRQQSDIVRLLSEGSAQPHSLLENDYLAKFLAQHHCQHAETMTMAHVQRALRNGHGGFAPTKPLNAAPVNRACTTMSAGCYRIGGKRPEAFDNELPEHRFECDEFDIAVRPVNNAEYLNFMEDGGYGTRRHWTKSGWLWLQQAGASHPEHWRRDARGWWFGIDHGGAHELPPRDPVYGISYHEAQAFAAWAEARLPLEYEWEIACRAGCLALTGRVWEWCDNHFHPYAGFMPFPYNEYSQPWFDGAHYTLRGASRYTLPDIRRASFRNFYTRDKRHIFAGLRLAF
jgi:iron(II)-dependent oxidoreductase